MPIYEYLCKKCGNRVELLQKSGTDQAEITCPGCGEDALLKVLSVTAPSQRAKRSPSGCDMGSSGACGGCCSGCH